MRPYDSEFLSGEPCPKCGEKRNDPWPVYYEKGRIAGGGDEHLELHCPRCGFKVFMLTKDASEAEAIQTAYEDAAEAAYKEEYGPDFDKLATYQAEGR